MKTLLGATLIGLTLLGTPLALVSSPATYACTGVCAENTDDPDTTEAPMPGWIDCGIALECLRS
jgi:hypothetical protein